MTEQTLLVIFIGMTALAWVAIAAIVVAIGLQIYLLVVDVRTAVARAQEAGESVLAEVMRMKEKFAAQTGVVRTMIEVALGAFVQKISKARTSSKAKSKKSAASETE